MSPRGISMGDEVPCSGGRRGAPTCHRLQGQEVCLQGGLARWTAFGFGLDWGLGAHRSKQKHSRARRVRARPVLEWIAGNTTSRRAHRTPAAWQIELYVQVTRQHTRPRRCELHKKTRGGGFRLRLARSLQPGLDYVGGLLQHAYSLLRCRMLCHVWCGRAGWRMCGLRAAAARVRQTSQTALSILTRPDDCARFLVWFAAQFDPSASSFANEPELRRRRDATRRARAFVARARCYS